MEQEKNNIQIREATVSRVDDATVRISGIRSVDQPVRVYVGNSPSSINRDEPAVVSKDDFITIGGLAPGHRYYFEVVVDGHRFITAERRVPLDGTVNFRDLGGYQTVDGRQTRWGRVFRSDGLSRLSELDLTRLGRMGIRRVFDFRSASEREEAPDHLPEDDSIRYVHLPITHGEFDFVEALKRLKAGDDSWLTPDFMVNGYINNIESFPESWGTVIDYLSRPDSDPAVFHCTGGKDRTGTCAALILLLLGVPEETVIEDHQLSNIYIAELLPRIYEMMAAYGVDPDRVFPYLTAPRECIATVLDHIRNRYGSAAGYLKSRANITDEQILQLKARLLAE